MHLFKSCRRTIVSAHFHICLYASVSTSTPLHEGSLIFSPAATPSGRLKAEVCLNCPSGRLFAAHHQRCNLLFLLPGHDRSRLRHLEVVQQRRRMGSKGTSGQTSPGCAFEAKDLSTAASVNQEQGLVVFILRHHHDVSRCFILMPLLFTRLHAGVC